MAEEPGTEGSSNRSTVLNLAKEWVTNELLPRTVWLRSEVAVAINWSSYESRIVDVSGRAYPSSASGEFSGYSFGTADVVAVLETGELYVADWKTGGTDGATEQLLSLACGLQRCYPTVSEGTQGWRPVVISCLYVDETGVYPLEKAVTQEELDNHWTAMAFAWEDIGKRTEKVPGVHCTSLYCPHLAYCSAVQGIVTEAADSHGVATYRDQPLLAPESLLRGFRLTDRPGSDEEAGYVAARITAAKRQLNYYFESLKDYIRNGGRALSGQYEWSEKADGFRWRKQK